MGIHYARDDLLGITGPPNPRVDGSGTYTDFNKPAILLYEPQRRFTSALDAVSMPYANAADLKRLAWRAHHRGTKEADMLIGGFFDAHHRHGTRGSARCSRRC